MRVISVFALCFKLKSATRTQFKDLLKWHSDDTTYSKHILLGETKYLCTYGNSIKCLGIICLQLKN